MSTFQDQTLFHTSLLSLFLIAPPTFISLRFLQAPYGKHNRPGWGPSLSPPLAWFLMESPTLWLTLLLFPLGQHRSNPKGVTLMLPFIFHYFNRTCIYPFRLYNSRRNGDGFPVSIAAMAFAFNCLNAYLQARWVSHYNAYGTDASEVVLFWARFCVGLGVFGSGMWLNVWSDRVLVGLRREGKGYRIPTGGWFEMVSCPNYLGEIVEWFGWVVMTWSWVGLGFWLYTCANLVPRARANHRWYLEKFGEDYPKSRKAVIPYLY